MGNGASSYGDDPPINDNIYVKNLVDEATFYGSVEETVLVSGTYTTNNSTRIYIKQGILERNTE